jgi:hypothetical protein
MQNVISKNIQAKYLDVTLWNTIQLFLIELLGEGFLARGLKYENNNTEIILRIEVK